MSMVASTCFDPHTIWEEEVFSMTDRDEARPADQDPIPTAAVRRRELQRVHPVADISRGCGS